MNEVKFFPGEHGIESISRIEKISGASSLEDFDYTNVANFHKVVGDEKRNIATAVNALILSNQFCEGEMIDRSVDEACQSMIN